MKKITGISFTFLLLTTFLFVFPSFAENESVKVAAIQYAIEGNKTENEFFKKIEFYVSQAKKKDAELVVFPELVVFDTWDFKSKLSDKDLTIKMAKEITPKYYNFVEKLSKKYNISILAGSSPRLENNEIYNTSELVFPNGRKIFQDKIFLTHWEKEMDWKGGDTINVFNAPWGKSVILICYDSEIPVNSHLLTKSNPELIFVPSMTDDIYGFQRVRWSSQARVVEHYAYAIVTGTVGNTTKSWTNYGQAVFLTPRDSEFKTELNQGNVNKAEIVYIDVDISKLRENRDAAHLYPARDQNEGNRMIKVNDTSLKAPVLP